MTNPATPTAASAAYSTTSPPTPAGDVTFTGTDPTVPILAEPTTDQRHAFDLIATTIPRPSPSHNNHNQKQRTPSSTGGSSAFTAATSG
jgi:hypothetical protein